MSCCFLAPCGLKLACMTSCGKTGAGTPANTGPSVYCVVMSDTVGVAYRAFMPVYAKVTGNAVCSTDPWTKSIIACCEKQSLIQGGACAATAAALACSDVSAVNKLNQPCTNTSWEFWLVLAIVGLIIAVVAANAFGSKLASDV